MPRHGGIPNLAAIATKVNGICRSDFYVDEELMSEIDKFDEFDRDRFSLIQRDDLRALVSYLDNLAERGCSIPMNHRGKPNQSKIARECGISRDFFRKNDNAIDLINLAI